MNLPIVIIFPPMPQTTTILALGFLACCLFYTPMIAVVGQHIPSDDRESVQTIVGLFKGGILLILGFYVAKVVNAGQQHMTNRAIDAAAASQPAAGAEIVKTKTELG